MAALIENLQEKIEISEALEKLISKAIDISFEVENFQIASEISIMLVDDERIKDINKEQRNIDRATDVLSFPLVEMQEGEIIDDCGDYDLEQELLVLGDIIISVETAKRQSEKYGHSFERELAFLVTHGVFHLLGYDHEDEEQEEKMVGKQENVLEQMGLKRNK